MIRYDLICEQRQSFDGSFRDFRRLRPAGEAGLDIVSALRLDQDRKGDHGAARHGRAQTRRVRTGRSRGRVSRCDDGAGGKELRTKLRELREHLTKNSDNVGKRFPEEARKMHYGEIKHRSIYGEAIPRTPRRCMRKALPFTRCRCSPRTKTRV